jgi:hypothetical protein
LSGPRPAHAQIQEAVFRLPQNLQDGAHFN